MQQKIVIKVSMSCEKSRSKAMAIAARANGTHALSLSSRPWLIILSAIMCIGANSDRTTAYVLAGVISVGITGDARDRLEVVGNSVDSVSLVSCLRKKLGRAEILQVAEVKDKQPKEVEPDKVAVHQQPYYYYHYPGGYYHHPPPPPRMVVCEEQNSCPIM